MYCCFKFFFLFFFWSVSLIFLFFVLFSTDVDFYFCFVFELDTVHALLQATPRECLLHLSVIFVLNQIVKMNILWLK